MSEASPTPVPSAIVPDGHATLPNDAKNTTNVDASTIIRGASVDASIADSPGPLEPTSLPDDREQSTTGESLAPAQAPSNDVISQSTMTMDISSGQSLAPDAAAIQKAALARQKKAARAALKTDLDANFIGEFDPATSWLPPGCTEEHYQSPEFVAGLERLYWRGCGVGKAAMYGADLPGSLFTQNIGSSLVASSSSTQLKKGKGIEGPIPWDVSNLPSALTRLLPRGMKIPGVNTPYLYFGMWRATFAWHVEDMDLFSINYIHWGVSYCDLERKSF